MTFYLGTHRPQWLRQVEYPLFISRVTLQGRKTFPRATCGWALDSGGFSELSIKGFWSITAKQYVSEVRRYQREIGRLQWAAIMDWMCEPYVLEKTGLTVAEHQRRTVQNYLHLRSLAPEINWTPVIQGWEIDDYRRHIERYARAGVDLFSLPVVGIGSVCRRQHTSEVEGLIAELRGLRLHGFGFKTVGLRNVGHLLESADSMAWSYRARHVPPLEGCVGHKNCANCLKFATRWRSELIAKTPALKEALN